MQGPRSRQHGLHRHTLWRLSSKPTVPTFPLDKALSSCTASALQTGALVAQWIQLQGVHRGVLAWQVSQECTEGGPISPSTCLYYQAYLEF